MNKYIIYYRHQGAYNIYSSGVKYASQKQALHWFTALNEYDKVICSFKVREPTLTPTIFCPKCDWKGQEEEVIKNPDFDNKFGEFFNSFCPKCFENWPVIFKYANEVNQ